MDNFLSNYYIQYLKCSVESIRKFRTWTRVSYATYLFKNMQVHPIVPSPIGLSEKSVMLKISLPSVHPTNLYASSSYHYSLDMLWTLPLLFFCKIQLPVTDAATDCPQSPWRRTEELICPAAETAATKQTSVPCPTSEFPCLKKWHLAPSNGSLKPMSAQQRSMKVCQSLFNSRQADSDLHLKSSLRSWLRMPRRLHQSSASPLLSLAPLASVPAVPISNACPNTTPVHRPASKCLLPGEPNFGKLYPLLKGYTFQHSFLPSAF